MKYLILVGDGMGDYPMAELGGKTPLEYAQTPFIDSLCQKGSLFFTNTIPEGYLPGSDIANMSLLGYDPTQYYTGRAPLEAVARGIALAEDERAYRCNMVTLDFPDNLMENSVTMKDFSAGHISTKDAHTLMNDFIKETSLDDSFHFFSGVSYRNLMVYSGDKAAFATVAPHDHISKDVTSFFTEYLKEEKWRKLIEQIQHFLKNHPINRKRLKKGELPCNMFWLWGEGKRPTMPSLAERLSLPQNTFAGTMISAVDLLKGLGTLSGLNSPQINGATGYIDTNYANKAKAALLALEQQDFVFVHLEAPDESGHNGRLDHKIQSIEDFDQKIVRPIIKELYRREESFRVVVTMDHFTPLSLRTHSIDPVPVLLYDSRENMGTTVKSGLPFCEAACTQSTKEGAKTLQFAHRLIDILFEK